MKIIRRHILFFLFTEIFLLLLTVSGWSHSFDGMADRPNILWIIVEDMSSDLGCFGNDLVRTPHIDELADQVIRFTHVFTPGVACSPRCTALVTGYYQNYIRAYHMRYPEDMKSELPDTIAPIHIRLIEKGYQTANIRSIFSKNSSLYLNESTSYTVVFLGDFLYIIRYCIPENGTRIRIPF